MLSLINQCFPFALSQLQLDSSIREWNLTYCRHDKDQALGWLGVRGTLGWFCFIAVHPDHRGRGLARQICLDLLEHARQLGLKRIQLEVLGDNQAAIRLYRSLGFQPTRKLMLWQGSGLLPNPGKQTWKDCKERYQSLLPQDAPWQRQGANLSDDLPCFYDEQGCLIFRPNGTLLHLLASPPPPQPMAGSSWKFNNVAESEPTAQRLSQWGAQVWGFQWEMELKLS